MENIIIVSDFDGTITEKDSLYTFFESYATEEWTTVEQMWVNKEISSKECLIREFGLVPNLSAKLIDDFTKTLKVDFYFKNFLEHIKSKNIDFIVVSDGIDYFINSILKNNGISGVKIVSNHAEFINEKFEISFPNDCSKCDNDAGTCKCNVVSGLRKNYDKIVYIGDSVSDFCVSDKADILFAKKKLIKHCKDSNIEFIEYENYGDIKTLLSNLNYLQA